MFDSPRLHCASCQGLDDGACRHGMAVPCSSCLPAAGSCGPAAVKTVRRRVLGSSSWFLRWRDIVHGFGEIRRKPCMTLSVRQTAMPSGTVYLLGGVDVASPPF